MGQLVTFQALPDLGMTLPQYFSGLSKTGVSADPPAGHSASAADGDGPCHW